MADGGPAGFGSALAEDDASASQVVRRKLDLDPVSGNDADVVFPHLAGQMGQDDVSILNLYPEHGVGERLSDHAFHFDRFFFICHRPTSLGTSATLVNSLAAVDFFQKNAQITFVSFPSEGWSWTDSY